MSFTHTQNVCRIRATTRRRNFTTFKRAPPTACRVRAFCIQRAATATVTASRRRCSMRQTSCRARYKSIVIQKYYNTHTHRRKQANFTFFCVAPHRGSFEGTFSLRTKSFVISVVEKVVDTRRRRRRVVRVLFSVCRGGLFFIVWCSLSSSSYLFCICCVYDRIDLAFAFSFITNIEVFFLLFFIWRKVYLAKIQLF